MRTSGGGATSRWPITSVWTREPSPRQYSAEPLMVKIFGPRPAPA